MATNKITFEDFYKTTTVDLIADSWDVDFEVWTAPANTMWWIIVNPESSSLRERMFYHDVIWSRVYVRWVNRYTAKEHLATSTVQINDSALIFNYLSENLSTAFYVEKVSWLNVIIWGWYILDWQTTSEAADTALTISNNTTNYIYYDLDTWTLKTSTSEATVLADNWIIWVEITTSSWNISEINYRKYFIARWVTWPQWDKWDTWQQWAIWNTWETQNINDLQDIDWTVTTSDINSTITVDNDDWTSTVYEEDWIYTYDESWEETSFEPKTWAYVDWVITYDDSTVVDWAQDTIQLINSNIAYVNKPNIFQKTNVFNWDTIFKWNTSFPYDRIDMTWITDILFNASNWTKQRTINLTTWSTFTLSFSNLFSWSTYELAVVNNTWWNITLWKWTIATSDTIVNFYSIWWTTYPLTLPAGVNLFVMETFDTAIHISYLWTSTVI